MDFFEPFEPYPNQDLVYYTSATVVAKSCSAAGIDAI